MGMRSALVLLFSLTTTLALELRAATSAEVNPIRKVVTLLQMMQKKVTEEGEKEKDLYDKFMCYCKNGVGDLKASIADNEAKLGQLPEDIKAKEAEKNKAEDDLKTARANLAAAKAAMKEATAIREKEAAAFAAEKAE